jgi:hypothetical protein
LRSPKASGAQLEGLVRAFRHAQQALFEEGRELALAQHQRGRRAAEGGDEIGAVGRGQAVMQGQVSRFGDDGNVCGGHRRDFGLTCNPLL